jgi:hypothetical protein
MKAVQQNITACPDAEQPVLKSRASQIDKMLSTECTEQNITD